MTEAFDKVRGTRELPLFPLSVVLFPGAPLPLHIFEPRYRRMLEDVRASGDNLFGISYFDASTGESAEPPIGHVGCVAEVAEVQTLPDGRSNIFTLGVIRYRVESYIDRGDPYLVGLVSYFEDEDLGDPRLAERAQEVLALFTRIARAVQTLNDERSQLQVPDLSETDPERLSFLISAAMEIDLEIKQELLEMRSTHDRLERLHSFLQNAVASYEERARMHKIAKGNGHSGKRVRFE